MDFVLLLRMNLLQYLLSEMQTQIIQYHHLHKQQPNLAAVMMEEAQHFSDLIRGPAAKEAMSAVMEKRRPDFSKC